MFFLGKIISCKLIYPPLNQRILDFQVYYYGNHYFICNEFYHDLNSAILRYFQCIY